MPSLERMKNPEKLELCRKYFINHYVIRVFLRYRVRNDREDRGPKRRRAVVGCFALPFMWLINFVWFFKEAFVKPAYDEQKQIRKYISWSLIGAIIWTMVLITWVTIFQLKRVDWGQTGDRLSLVIPKGML